MRLRTSVAAASAAIFAGGIALAPTAMAGPSPSHHPVPTTTVAPVPSPSVDFGGSGDTVDPVVRSVTVTPSTLVVQNVRQPRLTVSVEATDNEGVAAVMAVLYRGTDPEKATEGIPLFDFVQVPRTNTWRGSAPAERDMSTGKYALAVVAVDEAGNYDEVKSAKTVQVKRATHMTGFRASPATARKGAVVTTSGRLTKLSSTGFTGYAGQKVRLYFRPKGGTFSYQGTVATDRYGRWSHKSVAKVDGTWQALFPGNAQYAAKHSARDTVTVR